MALTAETAARCGMTTALMIAAAIVAVGAFLAWRMFPARVDRVEE